MARCIITSLPQFKSLEKVYGTKLAQSFIINYSIDVMKVAEDEEYYYPSRTEIKNWLTATKGKINKNITAALSVNPNLSEHAIKSLLKGVLHQLEGKQYITRGTSNYGSTVETAAAYNLIFKPNLDLVKGLAERFPNIFEIKDRADNLYTKEVIITPINDRDEAYAVEDRAATIESFITSYPEIRKTLENERILEVADKLAQKLQQSTGVPYEFIKPEDAYEILLDTKTPYDNQAAFYFNNKIYFVGDYLTPDSVLHEYGHPLIKTLSISNRGLFDNLYRQLEANTTGAAIIAEVKAKYPELSDVLDDSKNDRFKEECLVTALARDAESKVDKLIETEAGFRKFMTNLIYAIKQVLKSIVKKVNLKTLSSSTTLDQLSNMLVSEDFVVDKIVFDESDFAEFKKEFDSINKQFDKVTPEVLTKTVNDFYNRILVISEAVKKSPNVLKQELKGKDGTKIFNYIKGYMRRTGAVTPNINNVEVEEIVDASVDMNLKFRNQSLALFNSVNEINVFTENVDNILEAFNNLENYTADDVIPKINYYSNILSANKDLIQSIKKTIGLSKDNEFIKTLNGINHTIAESQDKIKALQKRFTVEFYGQVTEGMNQNVEDRFKANVTQFLKADQIDDNTIETFINKIISNPDGLSFSIEEVGVPVSKGVSREIVDSVREYYLKRLGESNLTSYLSGEKKDVNYFDSMLTPYMYMNDPIIAGGARSLNNSLANVQRANLKQKDANANILVPKLKAVNYTGNNVSAVADKILFTDKIGYKNSKTGQFEEKEVLAWQQLHKNYRHDRSKLQFDYEQALEKNDPVAIKEAFQAAEKFQEDYMYREFKKEVYDVKKMWTKENEVVHPETKEMFIVDAETSFEAQREMQAQRENLNALSANDTDELADMQKMTQYTIANMEYKKLYDVRNPDGTLKTGKELEKVLVRKKYRTESGKFYESFVDQDRIQKDFDNYISRLASVGITLEDKPTEFAEEISKWEKQNFRTAYTQEYYNSKTRAQEQIKIILNKPNAKKTDVALKLADLYTDRYQLVNQITDKNGQANGLQVTPETLKRLKKIEDTIVSLEQKYDKYTGLTKVETALLQSYKNKLRDDIALTQEETDEYNRLFNIVNEMGLGALEQEQLSTQYKILGALNSKEPTEYYIEAINYVLRGLEMDEVTVDNADDWINSPKLVEAMAKSEDFRNWFLLNHYEKETWDSAYKTKTPKIFRTAVWTVSKPNDEASYKTTTLINPITGTEMVIKGVPGSKYIYNNVKKEYKTGYNPATDTVELIVGKHITNISKNDFLPRDYNPREADSATDNKYINQEYLAMKNANTAEFQLVDTLTKLILSGQKDFLKGGKLYLDYPRMYHRSNLELIQAGKVGEKLTNIKEAGLRLVDRTKRPDAQAQGFNFDVDQILVTTDLSGAAISRIPIEGLSNLDKKDVSLDFLRAFEDYLASGNEQVAKNELLPLFQTISDVINDPDNANKNIKLASRQVKKATGLMSLVKSNSDSKRGKAFDYLLDKIFYGKKNNEFMDEHVMVTKITNMIMSASSRSIIGMDMVSAAKQRFGQKWQNIVEGAGGDAVTYKSLALGKAKSLKTIYELMSGGVYSVGPKSLNIQMMEYFDPITGKTEKDFSKSASRTFTKDMLDMTFMYDIRRMAELEGGLALYEGMMHNKWIDQTQPDGSIKKILYSTAFELDENNIIKLKDGINPEWGLHAIKHEFKAGDTLASIAKKYNVTVEELKGKNKIINESKLEEGDTIQISNSVLFNDFRLKIQDRGFKLNGLIDDFNSPQAGQYLGWKFFTFYKNFAGGFLLSRFQMDITKGNIGGAVYNFGSNTLTKGYYISAIDGMIKMIKNLHKGWPLLTKEEKSGMVKTLMEGALIALSAIAIYFIFGYDPDDEERFKKLKQRELDYGFAGVMSNHLLYQVMAVKSENEAFFPVIGTQDMISLVQNTSIALGHVKNLYRISADLGNMMIGDDAARYKSDVGPYPWQMKNEDGTFDYKLWNHIGAVWGVKGKNYDPITAIKSKETAENLGM